MDAAAFRKLLPRDFHRNFLSSGLRPDGRRLLDTRQVAITTGSITTANGSALLKLGNTSVLCGVKAEVAAPHEDTPTEGYLEFEGGRPTDEATTLSHRVAKVINTAKTLDMNSLCIEEGALVWALYVDVVVLDHSGNAFDAALTAAVAALHNVSLPDVSVNDDGLVVATAERPNRLALQHFPLSLSFGMVDEYLVVDPTREEEALFSAIFSVVYREDGKLCDVLKTGSATLEDATLRACLSTVKDHHATLLKIITESE